MGWIADLLKEIPSAARYKAELEQLSSEHEKLCISDKAKDAQIADLKSQLEAAQREVQRLTVPSRQKQHQDRPDIEERILLILAEAQTLIDTELAKRLGVGHALADHHIGELLRADMIFTEPTYDNHSHWQLTHHGLAYLAERQLIK